MSGGFGDSELAVSFLMRANQAVMHTQLAEIKLLKMATCGFGPVTVINCERVLFFVYIWIISWDATNRSLIQR